MSSAASAAAPAEEQAPAAERERKAPTRRSGLQLLAGLLVVAGIPVVATAHILNANALRNQKAHADAALGAQLRAAGDELRGLADDASTRAADLSASPQLQRAMLTNDTATIRRLVRSHPGIVVYVGKRRVAGTLPRVALTRSASLFLDNRPIGRVVSTIGFDDRLLRRLLRAAPHDRGDRLLFVRSGAVVGSRAPIRVANRTVALHGVGYRALLAPIPNAGRTKLLALRPSAAIVASVRPYRERVLYAAAASLALLVLVGLVFGRPILRALRDVRHLASQASTDSLTGLANRWAFDEELALEWRRAERVGDPLALILLDIDDFKKINDEHGHQAGDAVLRRIGGLLTSSVRHLDLAARYGGEEFAVVAPATDLSGAVELAERLRATLADEQVELSDGRALSFTASFGAAAKGDLASGEQLIAAADQALYDAKRTGKNRVAPELPRRGRRRKAAAPVERRHAAQRKAAD